MTNLSSSANSFALATRFLNALQTLYKSLELSHLSANYGDLNLSQVRILQQIHDNPGIRADIVIDRLDLNGDLAWNLILAMEQIGLVTIDYAEPDVPPHLSLGAQGRRLSFQAKATQLSILAEMIGKLPESEQLAAVEALEHLTGKMT